MSHLSDLEQQIEAVRKRIDAGEPGLLDEYDALLAQQRAGGHEPPDDDAIFDRLRVKKRPYTMSDAALEARRNNSQLSTGPVTPEGKAASSMNAWRHGLYARKRILAMGKPCRSTCPQYPCSLVDDGATQPGSNCLDKEYMLQTLNALSKAMADNDLTDLKQIVTLQLGGTLQVIDELQASILEYGVYMKSEKIGKDGAVTGYEIKPNPSLLPLSNLLKAAGVTMPDFMITPAAVEKQKSDKEAAASLADIFKAAGNSLAQAKKGKGEA